MDIGQAEYDLCMHQRGIEEPKVERLRGKDLREPGYAVFFEEGDFTIVDGHHRVVRRYRGGARKMDFWFAPPQIWQHCLIEYTEEGDKQIAATLPPKAENPEMIASRVEVHD
jgi:hypothetical protein